MPSVRPRVIPKVAVAPAHWGFGNNDPESTLIGGGHDGVNPPIRLTINEIVKVAALAFVAALVENPAPLEVVRKKSPHFAIVWFAKFSFFDVVTHNNVRAQRLFIALF